MLLMVHHRVKMHLGKCTWESSKWAREKNSRSYCRVAFCCASRNSYSSFVLSKFPACQCGKEVTLYWTSCLIEYVIITCELLLLGKKKANWTLPTLWKLVQAKFVLLQNQTNSWKMTSAIFLFGSFERKWGFKF